MGDDFDSYSAQLRKGVIQMLVLQVLSVEPLYGYAIVKRLEDMGDFVAGEGTVYPVLRRLEADGFLVSEWQQPVDGNARKYYSVTVAGTVFLARSLAEWKRIDSAVRSLEGE
jgi:PadR family transcriptional regulator PadR